MNLSRLYRNASSLLCGVFFVMIGAVCITHGLINLSEGNLPGIAEGAFGILFLTFGLYMMHAAYVQGTYTLETLPNRPTTQQNMELSVLTASTTNSETSNGNEVQGRNIVIMCTRH